MKVLIVALFALFLAGCSGCSNTPKTVAQAQVISFSQIASTMEDANKLYRIGLLNDKQHKAVHTRLTQAYNLVIKAEDYKGLPQQYEQAKEEIMIIYNEAKEMLK